MSGSPDPIRPGREALVARLVEISDFFVEYRQRRGSYRCEKHAGATHWGKLSYRLQIDGFLYDETGDSRFLARGLELLPQIVAQLRRHQGRWVFYPGTLHPRNAANHAIDSGAVVDSLADWYERRRAETPTALLEALRDACVKVATSYLPQTLGKPTNQALWALTGLAAAWRAFGLDASFREVCLRGIAEAFADQSADGSFPYLPRRMAGEDHPSLHDVSGFYHSRHLGFLVDVAGKIGHAFGPQELAALRRAADFLAALYGPDGRKSLELEAKGWYWPVDASHETASVSFDLHALAAAVGLFGDPAHRACLAHAERTFLAAADADGAVATPDGERAFQCRQFWSAHAAWVAKALRAELAENGAELPTPRTFAGSDSGVYALTAHGWQLKVRSRRRPSALLFGSYAAGAPWAAYGPGAAAGAENLLQRRRWTFAAPGELFELPTGAWFGGPLRLVRWLARERTGLRFAAAVARDHLRAGAPRRAVGFLSAVLLRPARFVWADLHASFWSIDSVVRLGEAEIEIDGEFARFDGSSRGGARSGGSSRGGTRLERTYRLFADRLEVRLMLTPGAGNARYLFVPPPSATSPRVAGAEVRTTSRGWWLSPTAPGVEICFAFVAMQPERAT